MKITTLLVACLITSVAVGAVAYWYSIEGKQLIEQIRQSDNKPFFFE